jgi:MYND finger
MNVEVVVLDRIFCEAATLLASTVSSTTLHIMSSLVGTPICQQCCAEKPKMKVCTRCRRSHHCSVECQKLHWPNHKVHCSKTLEHVQAARASYDAAELRDINHWLDSSRPLLTHLASSALYARSAKGSRVATHMVMLAVRYSPELHEVTILEADVAPLKGI